MCSLHIQAVSAGIFHSIYEQGRSQPDISGTVTAVLPQDKGGQWMKKKISNIFVQRVLRYGKRKVNRQTKDRLFRFLFEKDRQALLELYNALNGTEYRDPAMLEVVTIESAVYIVMKNDLAFVVAGVLNLYEHQSSCNPNMPVRFLIYLAQEYQKLIEKSDRSLYGTKRICLPVPRCIVFYNGTKDMPEEEEMRLSDAFENREMEGAAELKVKVLNINYGCNEELMSRCRILEEYARFVEVSRAYASQGKSMKTALSEAIDYCIENNILGEFLKKYRAEVLGMLLEEFDADKYERSIREEGREEGYSAGQQEGYHTGDAERMIISVEQIMKNLQTDIPEACRLIGVSVEEYQKAKANIMMQKA